MHFAGTVAKKKKINKIKRAKLSEYKTVNDYTEEYNLTICYASWFG